MDVHVGDLEIILNCTEKDVREEGGARTHDDRIMSRLNSVSERVCICSHAYN